MLLWLEVYIDGALRLRRVEGMHCDDDGVLWVYSGYIRIHCIRSRRYLATGAEVLPDHEMVDTRR